MLTFAEGSCLSGQSLPRDCQTDGSTCACCYNTVSLRGQRDVQCSLVLKPKQKVAILG